MEALRKEMTNEPDELTDHRHNQLLQRSPERGLLGDCPTYALPLTSGVSSVTALQRQTASYKPHHSPGCPQLFTPLTLLLIRRITCHQAAPSTVLSSLPSPQCMAPAARPTLSSFSSVMDVFILTSTKAFSSESRFAKDIPSLKHQPRKSYTPNALLLSSVCLLHSRPERGLYPRTPVFYLPALLQPTVVGFFLVLLWLPHPLVKELRKGP